MEASVLDLRKKMTDVMSAIDRRERITLTHRGRRKAVIVPLTEVKKDKVKVAELPAFGIWKDREDMEDISSYVNELRKGRRF